MQQHRDDIESHKGMPKTQLFSHFSSPLSKLSFSPHILSLSLSASPCLSPSYPHLHHHHHHKLILILILHKMVMTNKTNLFKFLELASPAMQLRDCSSYPFLASFAVHVNQKLHDLYIWLFKWNKYKKNDIYDWFTYIYI